MVDEWQLTEIKHATSLVDLIGGVVTLKKAGREYLGLCPFHDDHHASLHVNPTKEIYKCFSCGVGGDAFSFMMAYEHLTFPEAVQTLAQKAGIPITISPEFQARQPIYDALEAACRIFERQSHSSEQARAYIRSRGINPDTAERFRLGYSQESWDSLARGLRNEGFSMETATEAGLVIARENNQGVYDRFRNRLMFPIFDVSGRVIGFGGRALDPSERAKYLNSPETKVFDKSATLYGLNFALKTIGKTKTVPVVEGYADLVLAHQQGMEDVVSTLGTSFTQDHLKLLNSRFPNEKVILCFDGDEGGERGSVRAAENGLLGRGNTRICVLPEGKDPADLIAAGEDLRKYFEQNKPLSQVYFDVKSREHDVQTAEGASKFLRDVGKVFTHVPANVVGVYIDHLMKMTGLHRESVEAAVFSEEYSHLRKLSVPPRSYYERVLLSGMQTNPDTRDYFTRRVNKETFTSEERRLVFAHSLASDHDFSSPLFTASGVEGILGAIAIEAQQSGTKIDERYVRGLLSPKKTPTLQEMEQALLMIRWWEINSTIDSAVRAGRSFADLEEILETTKRNIGGVSDAL